MEPHATGDRTSQRTGPADTAFTFPLVLLFGLETLMGFVFQGFSTFLPAHLAGHAGIAALTAAQVRRGGAFASLALLFGGLGHLTAGRLMGYRHREALFLVTVTASTCCLVGMGTLGGAPLVLCSVLFSFTYFALGTISNTFMALHTPPRLGGTVFGITFSLAFGFGSMASSTMGILAERFGLRGGFPGVGAGELSGAWRWWPGSVRPRQAGAVTGPPTERVSPDRAPSETVIARRPLSPASPPGEPPGAPSTTAGTRTTPWPPA